MRVLLSVALVSALVVAQTPRFRGDIGPSTSSSSSSSGGSGSYWYDGGSGYIQTADTAVGVHLENGSSATPSLCFGTGTTCSYGWSKTSGNNGLSLNIPSGLTVFSVVKNDSDPTITEIWGVGNSDSFILKPGTYSMAKGTKFIVENGGSTSTTTSGIGLDIAATKSLLFATRVALSSAVPTVSSGFGTSPSVTAGKAYAFTVNVGTGGVATSGVITMGEAATTGWICDCNDRTTRSTTVFDCRQTATSTTTATFGNFNSSMVAAAWVASDILAITCVGY